MKICRITGLSPASLRLLTAGELIAWIGSELATGPARNVASIEELTD